MKTRMKRTIFLLTGLLIFMFIYPAWGEITSSRDRLGNITVRRTTDQVWKCKPLPADIYISAEEADLLCMGKIPSATSVEIKAGQIVSLFPPKADKIKIQKIVSYVNGNWVWEKIPPENNIGEKDTIISIYSIILLVIIFISIFIVSIINILISYSDTKYLFIFYCSVFVGVTVNLIVGTFTGGFVGLLAGGFIGLLVCGFAGGNAASGGGLFRYGFSIVLTDEVVSMLVGGFAGLIASGFAGFSLIKLHNNKLLPLKEYYLFLLLIILTCFFMSSLARIIKFKGWERLEYAPAN